MGLYFNSAEKAQQAYDDFADKHIEKVHESQKAIQDILDGKIPRTGETVDRVLEQASKNQEELLKSGIGYISQVKKAECNYQYGKADYKRLEKGLLPFKNTYCCVMKEPILTRKEDIEKAGLKEGDLQILFRLIPCVWFNSGILGNPDNGIPFITIADVADYLGECSRSDGAVGRCMNRLIENGIVWRYGDLFIMNDDFIRCGPMTKGVLTTRRKYVKKYQNKQGKKPTNKQGEIMDKKNVKIDIVKEPQTQATSGQETLEEIPF